MAQPPQVQTLLRNRLKIRQLLLLSALGELGNLRRSAARLGMTQPAATKLLHDLEGTLGLPLFHRSRRGMSPTLYGASMIRYAEGVLADLDAACVELSALSEGVAGTVIVGIMTSTFSEVLPAALNAMLQQHAGIRVSLMEGTHEMLMSALKRGELDLVLGRIMGGGAMDDVDLEVLYRDRFVIVCGPQHPLLSKEDVSLADTTQLQWILPHSTTPLRQRLEWIFMEQTGSRPRNAVECASLLTNLALLQRNNMLAVMPEDLVRQFSSNGLVRTLPIPLSELFAPVALITRVNRQRSPVVDAFIEQLRAVSATLSEQ